MGRAWIFAVLVVLVILVGAYLWRRVGDGGLIPLVPPAPPVDTCPERLLFLMKFISAGDTLKASLSEMVIQAGKSAILISQLWAAGDRMKLPGKYWYRLPNPATIRGLAQETAAALKEAVTLLTDALKLAALGSIGQATNAQLLAVNGKTQTAMKEVTYSTGLLQKLIIQFYGAQADWLNEIKAAGEEPSPAVSQVIYGQYLTTFYLMNSTWAKITKTEAIETTKSSTLLHWYLSEKCPPRRP